MQGPLEAKQASGDVKFHPSRGPRTLLWRRFIPVEAPKPYNPNPNPNRRDVYMSMRSTWYALQPGRFRVEGGENGFPLLKTGLLTLRSI